MSRTLGVSDEVRDYVQRFGAREHPVLRRCREETNTMGDISRMQVSCEQGALMQVLVKAVHARRAVEVGVFTGYSSTAVALAMQEIHGSDACLVACDLSEEYASRARRYWDQAGVSRLIQLRIGPAAETLKHMLAEGQGEHFDMAFIDADKTGYDAYYELCLQLLRSGGLMLIDNMLWGGSVADPANREADTQALRTLAAKIHDDRRVDMALATIGDGLSVVVKR